MTASGPPPPAAFRPGRARGWASRTTPPAPRAAKHAPGTATEVRLRVGAGEVTLTADSRAVPGKGASAGPGLGVISMRERAESVGGSCEAGPGGRGWLVRARLPLTGGTP